MSAHTAPGTLPAAVPTKPGPCLYVDPQSLQQALTDGLGAKRLRELRASRPHLFSDSMVMIRARDLERMRAVIHAIEQVVKHPYR